MSKEAAKPLIYSAGFLASVGLGSAIAALLLRTYKKQRQDAETSKIAESAISSPFSATEWQSINRERGYTEDPDEEQVNVPQSPVAHPVMGGIAGNAKDTLVIIMVGLPGRGKTAVAARTARYLSFFHGLECELFNVGDRRRTGKGYSRAEDYSQTDPEALRMRRHYNDLTLNELKLFLLTPGRTAIFDASNITAQRRLEVYTEIKKLGKVDIIFVELVAKDTMVHEVRPPQRPREAPREYPWGGPRAPGRPPRRWLRAPLLCAAPASWRLKQFG